VLLTQMHRDFQRVAGWYPAAEFVTAYSRARTRRWSKSCAKEIVELLTIPHLFEMNEATLEICRRWDDFCSRLSTPTRTSALAEADAAGKGERRAEELARR